MTRDDDLALPPEESSDHEPTLSGVDAGRSIAPVGRVPDQIGPYRILGILGEGGMGVVFEAEQREPRRRVALKVIRGGELVDDLHIRLFQREVETLARLKHPNIGAIYESGRTEDGLPFFAMELVRGPTLDAFLAARPQVIDGAELRFRLRLFQAICDAVHYAHQRSVIHRDLKPSNIVVTEPMSASGSVTAESALPGIKILDFGLARITDADVATATQMTEVGVIRGTLRYMSPEQAKGDPEAIDLRSDVYALGVLLYEILAGAHPYDLDRAGLIEAVRVICEEPARPLRETFSGSRRLDLDIETVVGMAMEKDADRRYSSAAALSEDVERFLASQPILARPPSFRYQLSKMVARHRTAVTVASIALILLVVSSVVSIGLYVRSERASRRAVVAAARSDQVAGFLRDMLSGVGPSVARGRDTQLLREVLENTAERVGRDLADQPEVAAELRDVLGTTYRDLGEYDSARIELERALELQQGAHGSDHPATLRARSALGALQFALGDMDAGERALTPVLDAQMAALGADHPDTLNTIGGLALILFYQNRLKEAEAIARPALADARRVLGDGDDLTQSLWFTLAQITTDQLRLDDASEIYRELLVVLESQRGADHPFTLGATANYGWMLRLQERYPDAESVTRGALERMREVLGNDHSETLVAVNNMAIILKDQGKFAEAEPYYVENVESGRRVLGDRHPEQVAGVVNLASFYRAQGRCDEAEPLAEESARILADVVSPDFIGRGFALQIHGSCLADRNLLAAARADLEEAYRIISPRLPPGQSKMRELIDYLARIAEIQGRQSDAAEWRAKLVDVD